MKTLVRVTLSAAKDLNMGSATLKLLINDMKAGKLTSKEDLDVLISQLITISGGKGTIKALETWEKKSGSPSEIISFLEGVLARTEVEEDEEEELSPSERNGLVENGSDDLDSDKNLAKAAVETQEGAMLTVLLVPFSLLVLSAYLAVKGGDVALKTVKEKWEASGEDESTIVRIAKKTVEAAKRKAKEQGEDWVNSSKARLSRIVKNTVNSIKEAPGKLTEKIKVKIKKGPRGGEYYETDSGEKVYV